MRATIDNLVPTDTDGDGDPDVTDPDDNDGIGHALDNEPLVASIFCIGGDAYMFSETVVGPLTRVRGVRLRVGIKTTKF